MTKQDFFIYIYLQVLLEQKESFDLQTIFGSES
jgi:hypothetical protein